MKKRILTGLIVLVSVTGSTAFGQDIYKTAANVPMVQLNNGHPDAAIRTGNISPAIRQGV